MSIALLVALILFILIFLLRMPIAFGMIASAASYLLIEGEDLSLVINLVVNTYNINTIIIAVPLFMFTDNVMNSGKVTDVIFTFSNALCGRIRGALGQVNILGSLIFSGMTGSAIADAEGLGKIEMAAMKSNGFDDAFSCSITAASATLGPVFPPSIPLVIYAMLSGTSVGALFMGGMIPAIFLTIALMVYVAIVSRARNYPRSAKFRLRALVALTIQAIPSLLTPVILLTGIFTGMLSPAEAGAIAGLYAILISIFAYKSLSAKELWNVVKRSIQDTGSATIIIGTAAILSYIVAREGIPTSLAAWFMGISSNKYFFLFLVNIGILILGMFIDTSTIQLIFVPILFPVARALGIDMVHFGLVVTFNMMIGLLTPPFGILLFITSSLSGTSLKAIIREILWPLVVMIVVLLVITYIPDTVLFLPRAAGLLK
ncbi:MAG: permease [Spirochaetae bacterium HGW-Spirochaetae-9]|nr:MAG: permease [Spirochaetae bacterium HGW-Spirochaetae-9]